MNKLCFNATLTAKIANPPNLCNNVAKMEVSFFDFSPADFADFRGKNVISLMLVF